MIRASSEHERRYDVRSGARARHGPRSIIDAKPRRRFIYEKIDKDIIVAWCLEKDVHSPRALFVCECID